MSARSISVDDGLLRVAVSRPDEAEATAAGLISTSADPAVLSVAHQALGLVLRDRGDIEPALGELRLALRLARRTGDRNREADVRASLGAALTMGGRTRSGLVQLDLAIRGAADPAMRAKALMRRGYVLTLILGRYREAIIDLTGALSGIRLASDRVWEARTCNLLGVAHLALGEVSTASRLVTEAERIFTEEGQQLEAVQTLQMRGLIAYCRGDLPTTLALYNEAAERFAALGPTPPLFAVDQAEALLSAGLIPDALEVLRQHLERGALQAVRRSELLLMMAAAELAIGHAEVSLVHAKTALAMFRRQRRDEWVLRAELAVLQARDRLGGRGTRLVASAAALADRIEAGGLDEAHAAWLVAGRLAARSGESSAHELLIKAARFRRHPSSMVRAAGWLATAVDCDLRDDSGGLLLACRRGLDAIDEHRRTLGSSELRASAAVHGDELAGLAIRRAAWGNSRRLLWWGERWRANALVQPPVRPPDDPEFAETIAALRDNGRRLVEARAAGVPTTGLESARTRLEQAVRRHHHHLRGADSATAGFDVDRLVTAVGDRAFVELINVDGRLLAVVVARRTVRRFVVGDTNEALRLVESARFGLRQVARGRPAPLGTLPDRLQAALLGPALRALPEGPVIISPTSRLHSVPWTILPALRNTPVSVVPSAALWLRASSAPRATGRPVYVAGPGMESGGFEVDALAARQPSAEVLRDGTATVDNCLRALDGASVAHIAAHGHFRSDSPLFSTLDLDDGALTVHDLARLDKAPHRLVLSACESGVMAPVGSGELLGFTAALLALGTVGTVSSVVMVNDRAAAEVSLEVHRWLAAVDDLPDALLRARLAVRGDQVLEATAAAFLALGA